MGSTEFFLGVLASFSATIVALIVFHNFTGARIEFSDNIRILESKPRSRNSYSIKVMQKGPFDLVDVSVHCRLAFRGINKSGSDLWNFYTVPTTFPSSLFWGGGDRIIHLNLHLAKVSDPNIHLGLKRNLRVAIPELGVRFEDFFVSYPSAYIQIFVVAHDKFSGTKKLYKSKRYYFHNLRYGSWSKSSIRLQEHFDSVT